ncbi:hypothetical protein [Sedimentimonas flavescens]|uniref:hypothetical protein n=1 Tax=Sedimentimonas flavescens TaxID=2851012 RepID=UPI001C4A4B29|nr:hypothetical protein [Sedimentimonas flavescens]MBW0158421.1 hypothetical protein [Sedimentimonas flavescens]
MSTIEQEYWTLVEAAAWVVFRDMSLVAQFAPPNEEDWKAFMFYPSMRGEYPERGSVGDLFNALQSGHLVAFGRRSTPDAAFEEIPRIEWSDLIHDVEGPYRRLASGQKVVPWLGIRVLRADTERLWRRPSEVQGRSRFDKAWFQRTYAELRTKQPGLSQNELILELQGAFQDETGREPPSRTSIQRYIKDL